MNKLSKFLDKYNTVIFDMDGVITSEQNYWNAAALTVFEHLNEYFRNGIDTLSCMNNLSDIRKKVFCDDKTIVVLKEKGVNSNWDLGYVVYCIAIILNTDDYSKIYDYAKKLDDNILTEYSVLAEKVAEILNQPIANCMRSGDLWNKLHNTFQEWFLGDEIFESLYKRKPNLSGKTGLISSEQPIINMDKLTTIFELMYNKGIRICTGTGRPYDEIVYPLTAWGLKKYIANDGFINYNHVIDAENELKTVGQVVTLTKPHPFMFLKAAYGDKYTNLDLVSEKYDKSLIEKVLVVGDAGADILAAQAMGADFVAVLTGISGQKARKYFEDIGATYILDSLEDFLD